MESSICNRNVLELPKNHFKDIKKVADFPYVKGGVNQHMENSIRFLQIIFESFPYLFINFTRQSVDRSLHSIVLPFCMHR